MSSPVQKCAICLEVVERQAKDTAIPTSCAHIFHRCCIETWSTMSNTCPLCKERFEAIEMVGSRLKIKCKETNLVFEEDFPPMISEDPCVICGSGDNAQLLLLCDGIGCDKPHHTYCMGLNSVPDGDWFCPECEEYKEEAGSIYNPLLDEQNMPLNVPDNDSHLDQDYVPSGSESESEVLSALRRSDRARSHTLDFQEEPTNETNEAEETNVMNNLEFDEESDDSDSAINSELSSPPRSTTQPQMRRRLARSRWTPPRTTTYCRSRDKRSPTTPTRRFSSFGRLEENPPPSAVAPDWIFEPPSIDEKYASDHVSDPLEERMLTSPASTKSYSARAIGDSAQSPACRSNRNLNPYIRRASKIEEDFREKNHNPSNATYASQTLNSFAYDCSESEAPYSPSSPPLSKRHRTSKYFPSPCNDQMTESKRELLESKAKGETREPSSPFSTKNYMRLDEHETKSENRGRFTIINHSYANQNKHGSNNENTVSTENRFDRFNYSSPNHHTRRKRKIDHESAGRNLSKFSFSIRQEANDGFSPPRPRSSLLSLFSPASPIDESKSEEEPLVALKRSQIPKSDTLPAHRGFPTEVHEQSLSSSIAARIKERREVKRSSEKLITRRRTKRKRRIPNYKTFFSEGIGAIVESDSEYEPPLRVGFY